MRRKRKTKCNSTQILKAAPTYSVDTTAVQAQVDRILQVRHIAVVADYGGGNCEYLYPAEYGNGYPKALRKFLTRVMGDRHFYVGGIEVARVPMIMRLGVIE